MSSSDLREALAALAHEEWSEWMKWLFSFGTRNEDGTFTIEAEKVARWFRQMETPYAELSEEEKDSDREEADRMIDVFERKTS